MPLTINITERAKRSDPLSYQEVDNNFLSLKNAVADVDRRLINLESTPAPTGGLTQTQVNSLIDTKIQTHLTSVQHGGGGSTVDMSAYLTKTDAGNTYAAKSHAHAEYAATGHTHDYAATNHGHAGLALAYMSVVNKQMIHQMGNITISWGGSQGAVGTINCPGAKICFVSSTVHAFNLKPTTPGVWELWAYNAYNSTDGWAARTNVDFFDFSIVCF